MYCIKDNRGNYASQRSYQRDNNKWIYISCTGRCDGLRLYADINEVQNILHRLQQISNKIKLIISFSIMEVSLIDIPFGEIIVQKC